MHQFVHIRGLPFVGRTSQHLSPKVSTVPHPSSESTEKRRNENKPRLNARRTSLSVGGEWASVFFDLMPSLTLMSDCIPLMHFLMPLVVAAAAWHGYKLRKLENGGKKNNGYGRATRGSLPFNPHVRKKVPLIMLRVIFTRTV